MCGQSIVYNIYATLANTNLLFKGFSCSQNVSFSSQRDNLCETQETRKARFYKGYRGCGKLSDVLDFKRYATHMQHEYQRYV